MSEHASTPEKPAFEFTADGKLFKIYENGRVDSGPSPFDRSALIVINRIPAIAAGK